MQATLTSDNGAELFEVPIPSVGARDVLVKVRAAGLNRADLSVLAGQRHGTASGPGTPLGLEWAGDVVAVGDAVKHVRVGERVMCSGRGGMAEFAVTDLGRVMPIPREDMSYEQAAGLPIALQTMHDAVITHGQLRPGQSLLVQGASAGVGLMAMQIAKWRGASCVIGTSTDAARRARLKELGADLALDSRDPAWVNQVLEATQGRGVDVVIDQLSGALASHNLSATAICGRIVNVGRLAGMADNFDFDLHALRRIHYIGVTFRTRSIPEVELITQRLQADLWPALKAGQLQLPIDSTFPLKDVAQAYARMKANLHFGKIIVQVG
ncbi:MAG: zinc-binding dehydrogenase [Limnohabitans sp.]|nr:zinc-binding dehydrogenase [Limnohabitans sp.]